MDLYLLESMSIILITAVVILLIFNKLKLPSMIGIFDREILVNKTLCNSWRIVAGSNHNPSCDAIVIMCNAIK